MSSTVDNSNDFREELDQRISGGFQISLLWIRRDNNLVVSVEDRSTGQIFELPVSGEEALDVFNHPFAYVAARGSRRLPDRTTTWTVWTAEGRR